MRLALSLMAIIACLTAADPARAAPSCPVPASQRVNGFLKTYLRDHDPATTRTIAVPVSLSGPGDHEVLVYVSSADFCGSGGCSLLVLAERAHAYRVVTRTTVTWPPILVLESRSRGWRDLAVSVSGGGVRPHLARLTFNGRGYQANPTVTPAVSPAPGLGETVIPKESCGKLLFR